MKETSKKIAAIAAKGAKHPESLTDDEVRRVCASALVQFEKEPKLASSLANLLKHVRDFGNDWAAGALSVDKYAEMFAADLRAIRGK